MVAVPALALCYEIRQHGSKRTQEAALSLLLSCVRVKTLMCVCVCVIRGRAHCSVHSGFWEWVDLECSHCVMSTHNHTGTKHTNLEFFIATVLIFASDSNCGLVFPPSWYFIHLLITGALDGGSLVCVHAQHYTEHYRKRITVWKAALTLHRASRGAAASPG